MPHETDLTAFHFIEGSTPKIDYTLEDEDGNIITAALTTQTASIYDEATDTPVPGWIDKDIDGAEGNLVTSGVGVWDLPTDATVKIDASDEFEDHIISMTFTYAGGTRTGVHHIKVRIYREPVLVP